MLLHLVITTIALQPQIMLNCLKMTFIESEIQLRHPLVSSLLTNLVESTTRHLTLALHLFSFHSSTCQTHANDMLPQLKAVVEEGCTAVVIIVDGGPDFST